jgi:hypothetical protein
MMSMENSDAYANNRPFWTMARPIRSCATETLRLRH